MSAAARALIAILMLCYAGMCVVIGMLITAATGALLGSATPQIPTPYLLAWWAVVAALAVAGYRPIIRSLRELLA